MTTLETSTSSSSSAASSAANLKSSGLTSSNSKTSGPSNQKAWKLNLRALIFDGFMFSYFLGALLIAFLSPGEETLLNLSQNMKVFLILFCASLLISAFFSKSGLKTLGEKLFDPPHEKVKDQGAAFKKVWSWQLLTFVILSAWAGAHLTEMSLQNLVDEEGRAGALRLFAGLATPNWTLLPIAVLKVVQTIFMAFMATSLAIPFAFVLSFFAAKNIMKGPIAFTIYTFLRTVLNVTRSIEALIWAIIFSVWVGIGPFSGMLALMIHSIASLTKQYSEIVESVSEGPIEGIQSTGASSLQVVWFAVVPQVVLPFISFTVYRWDINIRMATIVGMVGGGGIGTLFMQYQGQAMWSEVGTIVFVIAFVVWFMDTSSAYIREALK